MAKTKALPQLYFKVPLGVSENGRKEMLRFRSRCNPTMDRLCFAANKAFGIVPAKTARYQYRKGVRVYKALNEQSSSVPKRFRAKK